MKARQMSDINKSLPEVLALLRQAGALLRQAECAWPEALESAGFAAMPETPILEDFLHRATHEADTELGFIVQDIERLLERIEIRRAYAIFDRDALDRIVACGWSTTLVREIHEAHPTIPLAELSRLIKDLCARWGQLEKVAALSASGSSGLQA